MPTALNTGLLLGLAGLLASILTTPGLIMIEKIFKRSKEALLLSNANTIHSESYVYGLSGHQKR